MRAREIARALAASTSGFHYRRYVCVENVSWGLLSWEADFVAMSDSGYLYEVEIKVSHADLKADFAKHKHKLWGHGGTGWDLVKGFYYAMPAAVHDLAIRRGTPIPSYAGIITIHEKPGQLICTTVREAMTNPIARGLRAGEQFQLARLGNMRYWARALGDEPKEQPAVPDVPDPGAPTTLQ